TWGVRSDYRWRLDLINKAVGDRTIAQAADAWSEYKRTCCAGLSAATVQRHRATFLAALNYLAREEGFDPPRLPRGDRVSSKRLRFLSPAEAGRLIEPYADPVPPIP